MAFFGSDWLDDSDEIGSLSHWNEDYDSMKEYESNIKHFQDEDYDSMKEYEWSIMHRED